jgi:hypothetical protein
MGLSLVNMLGLSSSVRIAHKTCYCKFLLLHYIQVLCQYRLCEADHVYLTYLMLQRQLNHLNGCKLESESESYVTTDGQPSSLSWNKAPIWGLRPDLYHLCDSYGLVLVGRPLWREVGSVFCMCCWPLPAQPFSGPSPLGLETIFYCLTFEISLFVASYDSQGLGGGIRPRLHTGVNWTPWLTYWLSLVI